jgi:hypothetical protein
MSQMRRSRRKSRAGRKHAAGRITGLATVILAIATRVFALAPGARNEAIFQRLAISPVPIAARAGVSSSIAPPLSVSLSRGRARDELEGSSPARPAGPAWLDRRARKLQGAASDSWWLGMGGMALALAVCGGAAIAARRFSPRVGNGHIQVVGRVGLSPKHTVYLLRVGQRVLLVGTGSQGSPRLLGELDDLPGDSPTAGSGGQT